MQMPTRSSKRFEALVTDLTDKYRHNPYVKSTVNIIVLQFTLSIFTIAVFAWGIQYSQNHTLGTISDHIRAVVHGDPANIPNLAQTVTEVRTRTIAYVFFTLILLSSVFGFLMARFALRPTRDSLQFQKRFIGNVAHEIRTPLSIIKTSTEVALMGPHVPKDLRETLTETIVELDRVSETINNLLSFDNLIRPGRIQSEQIDLKSIAEVVTKRHQPLAHSRGILLSMHAPDAKYVILGNAVALDQVITNLVKNALNYTPQQKGATVVVRLGMDFRNRILVTVADTGIGIAQKDLYHIFEPFYRAETSRARGVGSGTSGLGLAIVNEIVRLHRGSIIVRSVLGRGTTIELSFPPYGQHETSDTPSTTPADDVEEVFVNLA
jgi:signal transduction histidine kinase